MDCRESDRGKVRAQYSVPVVDSMNCRKHQLVRHHIGTPNVLLHASPMLIVPLFNENKKLKLQFVST